MNTSTAIVASSNMASTSSSALRHPSDWLRLASSGRKTSWPVAVLAVSRPTTRPRRAENQRVATVAPSTIAVSPVPMPTITPQSRKSCHSVVIHSEQKMPAPINVSATAATRLTPNRFMKAAANGPSSPKSTRRIAKADEMSDVDHPNSVCSGPIRTPGAPTAPAVTSIVRKVTLATTHP